MIQLKPLLPSHKEVTFYFRNNPEIYKWCRQTDMLEWNNHCKWFDNLGSDKTIKMYSIENNKNAVVGVCGITDIDLLNRRAEFSLYIGKECQKKGYGRLALNQLLDHAFKCYSIDQIWGETIEGNPAIEMFKSLGLTVDGIRRNFYFKDGILKNALLMSITRSEFYDRVSVIRNSTAD
jgi:UDP-4-amino-4,6-dideoxy-N-acetyl-beta-L-altrosamine N-acetyltransferase